MNKTSTNFKVLNSKKLIVNTLNSVNLLVCMNVFLQYVCVYMCISMCNPSLHIVLVPIMNWGVGWGGRGGGE